MGGFTENAASGASEKPGGHEVVLMWGTAHSMLPLVRRIVDDILLHSKRLAKSKGEKIRLDYRRRTLAWPERSRRYELQEEIADSEDNLLDAAAELDVLGVVLLDTAEGRVGFPTRVNDRQAYFSWQPDDEGLLYWHYAGENVRRPIPPAWSSEAESRFVGKN